MPRVSLPRNALPRTTYELIIVADGVDVTGRDVLVLIPNDEMTVVLAVMGVITQGALNPGGEIRLDFQAMVDGRPITFVTHKKGDLFCRTSDDRPCAVMIATMRGDLEEDYLRTWRLRVPDLKVVDCRPATN